MDNLAPDLIVIVLVVSATAAPLSETPPSSLVIPPMLTLEGQVIVKAAMASVPAEKTTMSSVAKVVVAEEPVESVVQNEPVVFHVPVPVVCPEPGVAPLMSQNLTAA